MHNLLITVPNQNWFSVWRLLPHDLADNFPTISPITSHDLKIPRLQNQFFFPMNSESIFTAKSVITYGMQVCETCMLPWKHQVGEESTERDESLQGRWTLEGERVESERFNDQIKGFVKASSFFRFCSLGCKDRWIWYGPSKQSTNSSRTCE
ncbi:hypothetical protein L2E82_37407 [Cichorium intybus]|uniref:Uncharacterized protein n=1 Tax=Cichorium intybus TaxID=13427 RepID=A0ACB9ADM6_CICIN|nr:hypothetical protein L2E82_37407 [Cichorium intybus]